MVEEKNVIQVDTERQKEVRELNEGIAGIVEQFFSILKNGGCKCPNFGDPCCNDGHNDTCCCREAKS